MRREKHWEANYYKIVFFHESNKAGLDKMYEGNLPSCSVVHKQLAKTVLKIEIAGKWQNRNTGVSRHGMDNKIVIVVYTFGQ